MQMTAGKAVQIVYRLRQMEQAGTNVHVLFPSKQANLKFEIVIDIIGVVVGYSIEGGLGCGNTV
jgi:hypothetical protein